MILAYTLIYKDYSFGAIALCTKFRPSFSLIPLSFRGGLTYVVAYDFLSQLWDYDNPDLERLHAFAKSLLPRLYGKAEGGDPLEGRHGWQAISSKTQRITNSVWKAARPSR